MYINNITPRARSPLADGKGARPANGPQPEFGEALENVLIADAVEVAYFDPDDKERRKQQNGESAENEAETPVEVQTELFPMPAESAADGTTLPHNTPISEEKHALDIKV